MSTDEDLSMTSTARTELVLDLFPLTLRALRRAVAGGTLGEVARAAWEARGDTADHTTLLRIVCSEVLWAEERRR